MHRFLFLFLFLMLRKDNVRSYVSEAAPLQQPVKLSALALVSLCTVFFMDPYSLVQPLELSANKE